MLGLTEAILISEAADSDLSEDCFFYFVSSSADAAAGLLQTLVSPPDSSNKLKVIFAQSSS